ncbi:ATP-binding protein [Weeksellaceae bacterium KMM 9724]|uniref:AAA family ATPase n=1 Tax=Profundicola chukchiensis TaxID=2961959 RepID=UPI00243C50C0|nr:ATP-binding protein [Profundicola chukchiensis]MDG4951029.1 ATP-binding protein [Profundicola chukchiensis]
MSFHKTTLKTKTKVLSLDELYLSEENRAKLNQLIEEFNYQSALKEYDIPIDNKILLHGHTGCGKTATAHALGLALNKKVVVLNLGGFVSSRLGETGKNLSEVFRQASNDRAILFIDEFDFLGKIRDYNSEDSGEMQRLVNTFIQQIDNLSHHAILVCATNHLDIIDSALLRRFQLRLRYDLPNQAGLNDYYDSLLSKYPDHLNKIERVYGISYAEAKDLVLQQIKANIIQFEKNKKHLVFDYGMLEAIDEKLDNFGVSIENSKHKIEGFHKDFTVQHQAIAKKSTQDKIEGNLYEVLGDQLIKLDQLLSTNYKRVLSTTTSGKEAWIYISKY